MEKEYLNPETMVPPRGYSHGISIGGDYRTILIGGQNAVDEKGNLVGKGDLGKQTEQALHNIAKVLKKANASVESLVKFTIYLKQGQNPQEGFQAFQKFWTVNGDFPVITVVFVAGLGNPDWLVEIDAMAAAPNKSG